MKSRRSDQRDRHGQEEDRLESSGEGLDDRLVEGGE
jgi:hypothetical protein